MKSIVPLLGVTMLLSCENSIKEVQSLTQSKIEPELSAKDIEFIQTDSTRLVYRVLAPLFIKMDTEEDQYQEFPKGGHLFYYKKDGTVSSQIKANYVKFLEKERLWVLRNAVEAKSDDGKVINTELLYYDEKKELIYSDKYVRITTADNQVMEGNSFNADKNLDNIVLHQVTGEVYLEDKSSRP